MLEQMYRAVSGASAEEEAPKLPDDLTEEKMVTVVNAFFAASNTVLRDIVEELVAQARYLVPYRCCRLADDLLSVWWEHAIISQFQPRVCWCWRLVTLKGCNVVVGVGRCMQNTNRLFASFRVCLKSTADRNCDAWASCDLLAFPTLYQ